MKKLVLLILILFSLVLAPRVFAYDLIFTCSDSGCQVSNSLPLFSSSSLSPGETISKSIKLVNNSSQSKEFGVKVTNYSASGNLDSKIQFVITKISNSSIIWDNNFFKFANAGEVFLADLPSGSEENFDLTATFLKLANNDLQGKAVNFDLEFGLIEAETNNNESNDQTSLNSSDSSDSDSSVQGRGGVILESAASTVNPWETSQISPEGEVRGESAVSLAPINICLNPVFWLLLIVLQESISLLIYKKIKKNKVLNYFALQIISSGLFIFLAWKLFCFKFLFILSLILGVFDLYRLYKKIQKN